MFVWKMETAKARLSELLRQARVAGPQRASRCAARTRAWSCLRKTTIAFHALSLARKTGPKDCMPPSREGMDDDMDIEFERNPDTGREFEL